MAGRHSRLPEPGPQPEGATDQRLRAMTTGQPVVEEGVSVPHGGHAAFLSRRVYLPDGQVRTTLVRLDATSLFPYPPPDRPPTAEP